MTDQGERCAAQDDDTTSAMSLYQVIEESRKFLADLRAASPAEPADPDELQVRMMRRAGQPTVAHYLRVLCAEGMPAEQAWREARRMVEADRELLARYPVS